MARSIDIAVHVLTSTGRLRGHVEELGTRVREAARGPLEHLSLSGGGVDIVVRDSPEWVLPELGICGMAADGHTVLLTVDPEHERFAQSLDSELTGVLAHELHHVARHRGPGYGRTLFEAMVSEGLADHFSVEVTSRAPPPWATALSAQERASLRTLARSEYDSDRYVHRFWFFGNDEPRIPRWAGYSLGYELVGDYLEHHPQTSAGQLASAPPAAFRPCLK